MFSSLFRPKRRSQRRRLHRGSYSPNSQSPSTVRDTCRSSYFGREDRNDASDSGSDVLLDDDEAQSEEDGVDETAPLLPIFSAAHLDTLPVYNLTHSIRLLIVQRCETTLSWEQLRSPQISQFLVKPIQQQIRSSHFSRATLYALLANCLQFNKEGRTTPGNVGVCRTRGFVAELLAMRLLKEFSTRELIDALSYDFDPLKGITPPTSSHILSAPLKNSAPKPDPRNRAARTSTLEVAIRAQAKRFLAHSLVVQHLEAIWAGSVVFHSAADSLHRYPAKPPLSQARHYGATHNADEPDPRDRRTSPQTGVEMVRRSVTLYNPDDASLFKLSRLRVPRYRQLFSTLSFAVMLGLFVAVLVEKSRDITVLEVVFWFWSAGFMLDEIVGFTEQGFGLYIMSVWNAFDIGILLLFFVYYVLRLYGIIMADDQKNAVASIAYDVLASNAVLLFPRLFSLLDHYRYFSQLLIAFRLMAQDLVAILVLIGISCSGFFVAFTLAFGDHYNGADVAYALFQILMGFTPAAWNVWDEYNILGKVILTLFLIICHFLVVTILITVLTNSFMAIVKNANEEHQFLFAVNVLSMVKSDALFSYIAPTNIIGWVFSPVRYIMPFRQYVRVNRTVIKATHFPVLFVIFAYERLWLSQYAYEPTELVERRGRAIRRRPTFALGDGPDLFSPSVRVREPSTTTRYKDRALEEVFRRAPSTVRKPSATSGLQTNVVDNWMTDVGDVASPPIEQPRSILEQLEVRRPKVNRSTTSLELSSRRRSGSRSMFSDPTDHNSRPIRVRPRPIPEGSNRLNTDADDIALTTDGDGDDEDEVGRASPTRDGSDINEHPTTSSSTENQALRLSDSLSSSKAVKPRKSTPGKLTGIDTSQLEDVDGHNRQTSVNTIVFRPLSPRHESSSPSPQRRKNPTPFRSRPNSGLITASHSGHHTPKRSRPLPRPVLPGRSNFSSTPNITSLLASQPSRRRDPSFDLISDIGDNQHIDLGSANNPNYNDVMAGSYNTHMDFMASMRKKQRRDQMEKEAESSMMSRMVLARMNTLEEGFKDILKEVKEWRNTSSRGASDAGGDFESGDAHHRRPTRKKERATRQMAEHHRPEEIQPPETTDQPKKEEPPVQPGVSAAMP